MADEYPFIYKHYIRFCPKCSFLSRVNCGPPEECVCGGQEIELTEEIEEKIKPYYTEFPFGKMLDNEENIKKVESILKEYDIYTELNYDFIQEQIKFGYAHVERIDAILNKGKKEMEERKLRNGIPRGVTILCPYCGSSDVRKITSLSRVLSTNLFGLGSGKVGKQWHCNECKSDF